ncbi:hypothetical protein D3C86_1600980 [compost metagenome]
MIIVRIIEGLLFNKPETPPIAASNTKTIYRPINIPRSINLATIRSPNPATG